MRKNGQKFKNKYRILSTRLQNYDYGQDGAYFVTICTKNREHFFGEIVQCKMQYSDLGKIAQTCWLNITNYFPFVMFGEWVVMPNHVHGILMLDNPNHTEITVETPNLGVSKPNVETFNMETPRLGVSTDGNVKYCWKSGNLGVVINQYKRACTIASRKINPDFGWQSRFYDRIIRNENELNRISKYIVYNPQNWENDNSF